MWISRYRYRRLIERLDALEEWQRKQDHTLALSWHPFTFTNIDWVSGHKVGPKLYKGYYGHAGSNAVRVDIADVVLQLVDHLKLEPEYHARKPESVTLKESKQ